MLVIGKPAAFGSNNLPIRGQCQPHTQDWQLRIVHQGEEEVLLTDTYYACRQVQLQCMGMSDDEIRTFAQQYAAQDSAGNEETQCLRITRNEADTVLPGDTVPVPRSATPETPTPSSGRDANTEVIPRSELEQQQRQMRKRGFEE